MDNADLRYIAAVAAYAPSAHNAQPWRVVRVANGLDIGLHDDRLLKVGDPTGRDALLGLGCWAEAAMIGAAERNVGATVKVSPAAMEQFAHAPAAAPSVPLLQLRGAGAAPYPTPFTAADVRDRSVFRGAITTDGDGGMPPALGEPWLRLARIPGRAARYLVAEGNAGSIGRIEVAAEAVKWLRFTPRHPRFHHDGLTAPTMRIPLVAAAVAGAFTITAAGARVLAAGVALAARAAPAGASIPRHHPGLFVLVADGRRLHGAGVAGSVEHPTGLPGESVVDAGRALLRIWLAAHRQGWAVAPVSQVIDSPRTLAALRRGLNLKAQEVALAVFAAGVPSEPPPRAPRLPIGS